MKTNEANLIPLEEGDPASDARGFRRCLGQFATGVTVMTAEVDGRRVGVTANSFSSLSLDPPLILWSISRKSRSFAAFEAATHFAVNILADDQVGVSQQFASSDADKFVGLDCLCAQNGAPLIGGVVGRFECRREALYEGGDHIILVGRVERFARYARDVLLFVQGHYGVAEEHPDFKVVGEGSVPAAIASPSLLRTLPLSSLLFRAHHLAAAEIERHRRDENLTIAQARVLYLLAEVPKLSMRDLVAGIFLPELVAKDAVADMIERGQVTRDIADLLQLTTAGRERWMAVRQRTMQYHDEQLTGIPEAEVEAGLRFLVKFIEKLQSSSSGFAS